MPAPPLIHLASRSPRRRELLTQIGVGHGVIDVEVDETPLPGEVPAEFVLRLALAKARAGLAARPAGSRLPVLGADTAVVTGERILGKPADAADFLSMMTLLSGATHEVMTAVALANVGPGGTHIESRLSVSHVRFRRIDPAEARAYWTTREPVDKAGGYAVQGLAALFIERLEGSYSGVMGLPLFETGELLHAFGIQPLRDEVLHE